jgi:hypothetical protein
MRRSWWWVWPVIALLVAAPASAQTQPDEAAKAAARTLAETGRRRFEAGDYAGAIQALRDAERYFRAPTIRRLRARAHESLGQLLEARAVCEELAGERREEGAPPAFVAAQEEARESLASLEARIPRVRLALTNAPAGTRATLDGEPLDLAALARPMRLNPGKHVIAIQPPGAPPIIRALDLEERAVRKIDVDLASLPSGPPKMAGPEPTSARSPHLATPFAPPGPTEAVGRSNLGPALAFGAGGAGLIVGTVSGGMTFVTAGAIRKECGVELVCPPSQREGVEAARTLGHVSTVGFVVAGIGAVTGTVLLLWPGRKAEPARVGVIAGPTFLGVKGAF